MSDNLMYTPLESVFQSTMLREGKTVTAYTSGNTFQTFMRRNDDGNNFEDRITLYYSVNAPVIQGSLVSCGNKIYILVNRETEENNCYYKSSGLACNGMITLNDGEVIGVPCYAYNMNGSLINENQIVSVIDGNMEFITESNSLSRQIKIGNTFNEFGRTFKVNNIYYKDGILHLVTEVTMDEVATEHLNIIIDGLAKDIYDVGDIVQLTATMYINNVITTGTITWESTNTNVAVIDGNGVVNFIGRGTVAFKAYWVEKNTKNATNVVGSGISEVFTVSISGMDDIKLGYGSRTYTAILLDSLGEEQVGAWEWSFEFKNPNDVIFTPTDNKVVVKIKDNDLNYGEILTVIVHETAHDITATKDIIVKSVF